MENRLNFCMLSPANYDILKLQFDFETEIQIVPVLTRFIDTVSYESLGVCSF